MPVQIQAPNGEIVEFPDGTSDDVIVKAMRAAYGGPGQDLTPQSPEAQSLASDLSSMTQNPARAIDNQRYEQNRSRFQQLPEWAKPIVAATDVGNIIGDDLTFGFGDKAAAAARAAFTDKTYEEELAANRAGTQASRDRAGGAAYGADVAAALMMPRVGKAATATTAAKGVLPKAGRFVGGVVKGGAQGAGYGAVNALGHDQDIGEGATAGAAFGAAVPVIGGVLKGTGVMLKPFADAVRARTNPTGYANQKIADRLSASNLTVERAAQRAADQNITLADAGGDSTRDLLRTTTNIPGPARNSVNARLTMRQFGQGDRLKSAISQTFADPDGYLAAKEAIAAEAKRIAKPLYDRAYANPVHFSETLEGILNTPAGKAALQRAEQLAANEQVPFRQLFVNVADNGSATVRRVPDTRGWDYIKRAMDDIIDGQTDPITKKVTNEGRIITGLKNKMLGEIDRLNPDYKAARQAYAGQAQLDEALEAGRDVFKSSPEAFKRTVAGMTEAQKASARIGAAETLRAQIDAAGVTNNSVLRIFSKPQQIRNLKTLFETPEKFAEFRKMIWAEARKRGTYEAVKNNSSTVRQAADMAEAGGLQEGFDTMKTVASGRPVAAALQFVGSRLRMLGGMTPQVADEISKRLLSSSPEVRARITQELQQIEQSQISAQQKRQAVQSLVGRLAVIAGPTAVMQSGN